MSVPEEERTRQEKAVVAAAVLGVEDHAQVQHLGLLLGEAVVVADGIEEVLGEGEPLLGAVEIEGVVVEVVALGGVGVGHDHGATGHQLEGLTELILQRVVLGGVIIAIECQDAPAQPVHDVPARRLEDHVLGEVHRQGPELGEDGIEIGELLPCGQGAEEQEVGGLLEAEAPIWVMPAMTPVPSAFRSPRFTSMCS